MTECEIYGCEFMKESAIIPGCNLSISSATMTMFWMIRMRSRTILIKGETLSVELFVSIDKHCDCYSLGIDLIIIQPCAGAKFCAESFYGIFSKIITFTEWHPNTPRPQGGLPSCARMTISKNFRKCSPMVSFSKETECIFLRLAFVAFSFSLHRQRVEKR